MEEENENENESIANIHKTSQKHKTRKDDYKIDPEQIPRPNSFNELYYNDKKEPIYFSSIDCIPPFASTFYKVKEIENSNCHFIRSSLTKIPTTQKVLSDTHLIFGIYLNPFADINEEEENQIHKYEVDSYDVSNKIIRCNNCKAYMNKKFSIDYNFDLEKCLMCNICQEKNHVDNKDIFVNLSKIKSPTIEYKITHFKKEDNVNFSPRYIFFIDASYNSFISGYTDYVIKTIQSNICSFHNGENSYISVVLINENNLRFFYKENKDIRCSIVNDLKNPFCPIDNKKMFIKIINSNEEENNNNVIIESLFEKVHLTIELMFSNLNNSNQKINSIKENSYYAAIDIGIKALMNNGGRIMLFSMINNMNYNSNNFSSLIDICNNNKIVIDQFILVNDMNENNKSNYIKYIKDFSYLSNETGGHYNAYKIDNLMTESIVNSIYEKIYYDYINIISNNNYYNVKFMIRFTPGIDCYEILGSFGKKLGEAFQIGGCDNNFSFCYLFRIEEGVKLNNNQEIHFQVACLYNDNYSNEKLRLFNYTIQATTSINKIYSSCDVDVISKLTLMREINLNFPKNLDIINDAQKTIEINNKLINSIFNRILVSFKFYRNNGNVEKDPGQLILPSTLKYFPLYLFSFLQKMIFYEKYNLFIINLFTKILRESLDNLIKFLYPRLYRIDDIETDQKYNTVFVNDESLIYHNIGSINKYNIIQKPYMLRLSLDNIDFDSAYLINDGEFINLYIFEYINNDFYYQLFNKDDWEQCYNNTQNITDIVANDNYQFNIKIRNIINQCRDENNSIYLPLRIFFLNEKSLKNKFFLFLSLYLIEDKIIINDVNYKLGNYIDFLCKLHKEIQKE